MVKKLLVFLIVLSGLLIAQVQIRSSVIGSGGGSLSNTQYTIFGTLGQAFIGNSSSSINQLFAGFWNENQMLTPVLNDEILPVIFKLEQNYPNPFNPSTVIQFSVPQRSNVMIKIYDVLGSEVATLVQEEMERGWYTRTFDAARFSSGVYIYRMEAGNYINTKKMLLVK